MDDLSVLEKATQFVISGQGEKPDSRLVAETLVRLEKNAKKTKERYTFDQIIGDWRLCWLSGTNKIREQGGGLIGSGRYVPRFVKIKICYSRDSNLSLPQGMVHNSVELGVLQLTVAGPARMLDKKNIVAFDFTRLTVKGLGRKFYEGTLRGGTKSEEIFYQESIAKQAFFAYFLISDRLIAARGREGGIALWAREK